MPVSNLSDYPQTGFGSRRAVIADLTGPNPYAVIGIATPPTGGQLVRATDLGLVNIESLSLMGSDDGQYSGVLFPGSLSGAGQGVSQVRVMWVTAATEAQAGAVDLSGRTMRLMAIGY